MLFFEEKSWIYGTMLYLLRYFVLSGAVYFIFYIWKKKRWSNLKIQQKLPERKQMGKEIFFSFMTLLIYNAAAVILFYWYKKGITKIYLDIHDYGWPYLLLSVLLIIVLHDAYFYWTHRLMHASGWLYKFHKVHHHSHNPTPWAAFSFHPAEALISLGIIPVIVFILPVHPLALLLFGTIMTAYNIMMHLGYEIVPKKTVHPFIRKWQNTTTNHDLHHEIGGGLNYGFYFTFWDRVMGTFREDTGKKTL